ncbi:chemotaxis protein CheD [Methylocella sp.]|uniref:chemotaxis protein CheD n=1 Tax=Methylocella sp. TaxID=1978226 RepID=UPI003783774F
MRAPSLGRDARRVDLAGAAPARRLHLVQGESHVSADPDLALTTLLGSCVAACLHDPLARIGGMNHFLLPGVEAGAPRDALDPDAVHLMELLVNGLLREGAKRERLEAKLFGGGRPLDGLSDVGARNAGFALRFLAREGVRVVGGSLGGDRGRRLQFWPTSGRARQSFIDRAEVPRPAPPRRHEAAGAVEFF